MTNSLHIKIEYPQALSLKKETLSLQEKFLHSLIHLKTLADLKKRENLLKNKIKSSFSKLGKEIYSLQKDLPEIEKTVTSHPEKIIELKITKPKKEEDKIKKQKEIAREIKEIQEKLARLS